MSYLCRSSINQHQPFLEGKNSHHVKPAAYINKLCIHPAASIGVSHSHMRCDPAEQLRPFHEGIQIKTPPCEWRQNVFQSSFTGWTKLKNFAASLCPCIFPSNSMPSHHCQQTLATARFLQGCNGQKVATRVPSPYLQLKRATSARANRNQRQTRQPENRNLLFVRTNVLYHFFP